MSFELLYYLLFHNFSLPKFLDEQLPGTLDSFLPIDKNIKG